jgi:hypothetical protein
LTSLTQDPPSDGTLLFIYAADSGLFNTVADIAHKILAPHSYPCQLCSLTHGYFQVRKQWQQFIATLPVPCLFLHRDELAGLPDIDADQLPAVYGRRQGRWQLCLGPAALSSCSNVDQLMTAINESCVST